ncbi:hypothetical protein [Streptomyces sp. M92]|uniref:hypothetical protein n=1 Tax=Streptomyces sp. M92 TaxID=2944250 RepID=UPI00234B5882|nr:hypothetical protein [Streptomyces sp. M92]WCN05022.1 hypothetical protein M6G08_24480 [Streptomyces sp. M92]
MALETLPAAAAAPHPRAASGVPPVSPTPQSLTPAGEEAVVTGRVIIVADENTDAAARDRLVRELETHGAAGQRLRQHQRAAAPRPVRQA